MHEPSRSPSSPLTGSESIAAALVATPAIIVVAAYLVDLAGWPFPPSLMLPIGLVAGTGTLSTLGRRAVWDRAGVATFALLVTATFAWLMWLARSAFLPLGGGPDLTHHILLIQYIERHWRLVHVPGVQDYLGEMVYYTPGSHILTALVGAWSRTTGFHALHAVMAAAAALKVGFVFLIAGRILPRDVPRLPIAAIGALSLFVAQTYFLGSFTDYSFLAQVVSELFALAMWWTLTVWDHQPTPGLMAFAALTGAAVFLTWPLLIGPPLAVLGALVVLPHTTRFWTRFRHAVVAIAPILTVAGLFTFGRTKLLVIAGTGGEVAWPSVDEWGWWFLGLSTAGIVMAGVKTIQTRVNQARAMALFTVALGLQAAALYGFARWRSNEPYMALKMFYLLLYLQAVGVALAVGTMWRAATVTLRAAPQGATADRLAWLFVVVAAILVGRPLAGAPKSLIVAQHPAASLALEQAGEWARAHAPVKCVEYLVADDQTAYWLHLAVLGNPRMGQRTADNATYELTPTLVRWLTPGGLPYAIADLPALPSGVRDELDIVAQFGTAAVVKRRGPSSCDER